MENRGGFEACGAGGAFCGEARFLALLLSYVIIPLILVVVRAYGLSYGLTAVAYGENFSFIPLPLPSICPVWVVVFIAGNPEVPLIVFFFFVSVYIASIF